MKAAKRHRWAMMLVATALLTSGSAYAAGARTATASIEITATVVPNCRLSVTPLTFGAYDPLVAHSQSNLDATAAVVITCTRDSQAAVEMDLGRNAAPGAQNRFLSLGDAKLAYDLFRDAARTQQWGTGADALSIVAEGIRAPMSITVYGRIPPAQEVPAGTYNDIVTATVDF